MLDHEKLDVYQRSVDFLEITKRLIDTVPRGNSDLVDQLRRAATSILLNIAEGSGKPNPADRRRFYMIARGSAMECGAALDACKVLKLADESC